MSRRLLEKDIQIRYGHSAAAQRWSCGKSRCTHSIDLTWKRAFVFNSSWRGSAIFKSNPQNSNSPCVQCWPMSFLSLFIHEVWCPASFHPRVSAPSLILSVQQDEGLQLLGDVSPILEAVLDDGPGGEALQGGVVYGLDDVPGQFLLIQEVTGSLLKGIGAVEMSPGWNQQVHDVRVAVCSCDVKRTGGWEKNK